TREAKRDYSREIASISHAACREGNGAYRRMRGGWWRISRRNPARRKRRHDETVRCARGLTEKPEALPPETEKRRTPCNCHRNPAASCASIKRSSTSDVANQDSAPYPQRKCWMRSANRLPAS